MRQPWQPRGFHTVLDSTEGQNDKWHSWVETWSYSQVTSLIKGYYRNSQICIVFSLGELIIFQISNSLCCRNTAQNTQPGSRLWTWETDLHVRTTKIKLHWLVTWIHGLHNNFISLPYCEFVHFFLIDPNLFILRVYLVGSFSLWVWEGSKYDTKKSLVQHSMNKKFFWKTFRL